MTGAEQILKGGGAQDAVDGALQVAPEGADRAAGRMRTTCLRAGVPLAEIVFVHAAAEDSKRVGDPDPFRRKRESVTAHLAPRRLHQSASP